MAVAVPPHRHLQLCHVVFRHGDAHWPCRVQRGLDPSGSVFKRHGIMQQQSQKSQLTSRGEPHHAPGLEHTGRSGEEHAHFPLRYYPGGKPPAIHDSHWLQDGFLRQAFHADSSEVQKQPQSVRVADHRGCARRCTHDARLGRWGGRGDRGSANSPWVVC